MSAPRILFAGGGTGGHLYPALNIADAMRGLDPSAEFFFLGSQRGIEARVLPDTGYPYALLPLQPILRTRPWRNWRLLWTAPAVVRGVTGVIRRFCPSLVAGTGGYVSGPALGWAALRRLPTAIQEQNAEPGLVTRWLAPRVDQIHLGYPEAERRLSAGRAVVHAFGNPVAPPSPSPGDVGDRFEWPPGRIVLVVGGSQGARGLNACLLRDLEQAGSGTADSSEWPADVSVVWVAGRDHAAEVAARVGALPWTDRILVVPFISGLGAQLDRVTLALSRAGAMLVAELCAAGCPAVYVPFPAAAGGHQSSNAKALADIGAALVREEKDLHAGELWGECRALLDDGSRLAAMSQAARSRARPEAATRIAEAMLALATGGRP